MAGAGRVRALGSNEVRLLVSGGWTPAAEAEVAAGGFDRLEFHSGDYEDFRFLAPYKAQIRSLAIMSGNWASAAGLEELDALRTLSIGPALKGLDLSLLPGLRRLNIDGWLPRYASSLFRCAQLESLRIEGYDGGDCERFGALAQLRRLTLAKGKLVSFNGLAQCGSLEALSLSHLRKLTDIAEVARLGALRELEFSEKLPALCEFGAVFGLTDLHRLDLRGIAGGMRGIGWLRRFTELRVLGVGNVGSPDWDALFASPQLKKLVVTFTEPTGLSVDEVREIAKAHGLRPSEVKAVGVATKQKGYLLEFRPDGSEQNLWYWRDAEG
jgi:hypothetical protein